MPFDVAPLPSREILEATPRHVKRIVNCGVPVTVHAVDFAFFHMRNT